MNEAENPAPKQVSEGQPTAGDAALNECQGLINHFHKKAKKYKRLYRRLKYSSIVLAVSVTVLSALSVVQQTVPWILPVASGLTALTTALLGATNAQEIWVRSRTCVWRRNSRWTCAILGIAGLPPSMRKAAPRAPGTARITQSHLARFCRQRSA